MLNDAQSDFASASAKKLKLDTNSCLSPQKGVTDTDVFLLINMSALQEIFDRIGKCMKCSGKFLLKPQKEDVSIISSASNSIDLLIQESLLILRDHPTLNFQTSSTQLKLF